MMMRDAMGEGRIQEEGEEGKKEGGRELMFWLLFEGKAREGGSGGRRGRCEFGNWRDQKQAGRGKERVGCRSTTRRD
jgi:hypothetical protein